MLGQRLPVLTNVVILAIVLAAQVGCSSAGSQLADPGGLAAAPPMSLMPQIPSDGPIHKANVAQSNTINGASFFQKSAAAIVNGTKLQLNSTAGHIEWAIYEFPTAGATLTSLNVDVTVQSGGPVWLGLADYTKHVWDFAGPYTPGTDVPLNTSFVSPGGSLFFVVVAYNGTQLLENSATVVTDVVTAPVTIDMPSGFPHMFNPTIANVDPGAVITFMNSDAVPHTATVDPLNAAPGGPSSPTILSGGSYDWTVPSGAVSGTKWFYHCTFHGLAGDGSSLGSGMAGEIIVN